MDILTMLVVALLVIMMTMAIGACVYAVADRACEAFRLGNTLVGGIFRATILVISVPVSAIGWLPVMMLFASVGAVVAVIMVCITMLVGIIAMEWSLGLLSN